MAVALDRPFDLFIGGQDTPSSHGERRTLLNPATNRPLAETAVGGSEDARHALEVAEAAVRESGWGQDDGARRAKALHRLAGLLEEHLDAFAELETLNMGKTLRESRGDLQFTIRTLEYVGGLADKIQGETIPVPGHRIDYTVREPLGVTVHLSPWNYPLLLAIRSVAPALAAGNAVVLKPASLTPLSALEFAHLAKDAGVPDGILNVVVGPGAEVGEALVRDPRCASVTFTGSVEVGQRIAELAAARRIPLTLELGGKSPVLVFPDADLDRAAKGVAWGIFGNAGQMCWAGSRLLVHESIHEPFVERVRALAEALKVGPGIDSGVEMGPVVSSDQADRVLAYVDEARSAGARVVCGGSRYDSGALAEGNFVKPTVVTGSDPASRIVREEVFGPVLSVLPFHDAEEAVRLANDSRYGLLAAVWTRDLGTAHGVARQLEAGMIAINDPPTTFPQTPFAGFKESGVGSEQGTHALEPYTRVKNVLVNLGPSKKSK